ncbi:uncharacterized protein CXQ87_002855 [Candidozyma duobushaemuli]|uniref:Uncharacterized protein n=2 Tax=Candidozyma TaxID=3303203 RepID=A0ABX8I5K8_9ASCO|nr:uncharacterized protein CXQ87_002855 [[Candida] duobushaemulonis]PVH14708.1 hypothetical protein CXQ87_002855 [[Candida] duobushaemulonis]QWU87153.1 hypothetical protein CA3LBN_001418 [[Candida] haemuloni]
MSKAFTSKTKAHLESYSVVKKLHSYLLSFQLVQAVTTYVIALSNYFNDQVISRFPFVVRQLSFADETLDGVVLGNFDKALAVASQKAKQGEDLAISYKKKGEDTLSAYKKKGEDTLSAYKKKGENAVGVYLKPVNDYASSTVDKVLPKVKNATKKAEKKEKQAENEISKSIEIVNDTYSRSKDLLSTKSSDISNTVLSTYNKEFDSSKEKNYYVKVASASVTTGVKLLKSVNSDYIQPLKSTTQSYVTDVASQTQKRADDVVSNGVAEVKKTINGTAEQTNIAVPTSA